MGHKIWPKLFLLWTAVILGCVGWLRPVGAAHVGTARKSSQVVVTPLAEQTVLERSLLEDTSNSSGTVTERYVTQLTKEERQAYAALAGADLKEGTALWKPSVSFTVSQEISQNTSLLSREDPVQKLFAIGERALYAFRLDYMDRCYWMYDCDIDINWVVTPLESGKARVDIQYLAFRPLPYYGGALSEDAPVQEALSDALERILEERKNPSRAETIQAIASYMARRVSYSSSASKACHTLAGPLLSKYGRRASCEGYARTVFILCKKLGIPVLYVESKTHAFNYVQLENGVWYGVDASWADLGSSLDSRWLLYGSDFSENNDPSGAHAVSLFRYGARLQAVTISRKSYEWK